jgi:hypothetical protein
MAKATISIASALYPAGTRSVELPNLSSDDLGIKITLTRESWPDTGSDVVSGIFEQSEDGNTWASMGTFGYVGGTMTNPRTGQVVTSCGPTRYWDEFNGVPHRPAHVRLTITNTVSLQTAITLTGA